MESPSNQLRIRDNATVEPIIISEARINAIIIAGEYHRKRKREDAIAILRGRCCVCGDKADLEVTYPLPYELVRKEKYCQSCIKKVYQREQVL